MLELKAHIREKTGNQVKSLRRQGLLPAVLYRKSKENVNLQLNYSDFAKIFKEAGESTIIKLKIEDDSGIVKTKEKNVLVAEVAREPLTSNPIHVDFYEVKMDEKLTAVVPLVFIGEASAVKTEGGTLVRNIQEVEVKALPQDLPRQIEVDISSLVTFNDHICLKDLLVSDKIEILGNPEEVIALVVPPRKEEEIVPPVEEVPVEKVPAEGVPKEPKEEERTEELPTEGKTE